MIKKPLILVAMATIILLTLTSLVMAGTCKWAPYKGSSSINKNATTQYFKFTSGAISIFAGIKNCTYEHETQVYNKSYVNISSSKYWTGNLPYGYLDTQAFDSGSVDNITVGTCTAAKMSSEKWYYYTIALSGQSASSATVRIKGQRGHLAVSGIYSTWNVFADETSPSLVTFTAPNNFLSWSY